MPQYKFELTMPSRQTTDEWLRDVAKDQGAQIKIDHRGHNVHIESTKVITIESPVDKGKHTTVEKKN